jgi:hypothetical protein
MSKILLYIQKTKTEEGFLVDGIGDGDGGGDCTEVRRQGGVDGNIVLFHWL